MFDLAKEIESALENPSRLEELYQNSLKEGKEDEFNLEINRLYQLNREDRLISAWYYRLKQLEPVITEKNKGINWKLVAILSGIQGLLFGVFTQKVFDTNVPTNFPFLFLIWSPLTVAFLNYYLLPDNYQKRKQSYFLILFLFLLTAYGWWMINQPYANLWLDEGYANHYFIILLSHLPLLSWLILGWCLLNRDLDPQEHQAFFLKSTEIILIGGILFSVSVVFIALASSLFSTLGIYFREQTSRWVYPFIIGLIPIITVSLVYTPGIIPSRQNFQQGLAKLIPAIGSIFTILMLILQIAFLIALPFNFWQPFQQREVLLIYNIFLLFTLSLLFVSTPLNREYSSEKVEYWLRKVLFSVGILSLIICLYAFSAIIYRTFYFESLTVNRFTVIGWNIINISLLITYLYYQIKLGKEKWIISTQRVLQYAMVAYTIWVGLLLIILPALF